MTTKFDLYVGAPIEHESERQFLRHLRSDLETKGEDAIVFANMLLPKRNPLRQVDFLLILRNCVCHIEHKRIAGTIVGEVNGDWSVYQPDGSLTSLQTNSYRQALECKYSVSDEMHAFAAARTGLPTLPLRKKYYSQIESVVCVFPSLLPGSKTPDDQKVRVKGYPEFVDFVISAKRNPGWTWEDWIAFAVELGLVHQGDSDAARDNGMAGSRTIIDGYCRRFREFCENDLPPLVSGVDKRVPLQAACRERTTFIVHTLGQIGTGDDIKLLEPLVNDAYYGRDAVEAIRRLNANQPFVRLNVLFRWP